MMNTPQIVWDIGTAYDFFISLSTLHHPNKFGLRGAWAAGVRSRLPTPEREFLQDVMDFMSWPVDWVYQLPQPKNAQTALNVLSDLAPAERLPALTLGTAENDYSRILRSIAVKGSWDTADEDAIWELHAHEYAAHNKKRPKRQDLSPILKWWVNLEEFGNMIQSSLQAYYDVFFAEDELRIEPALRQELEHAQKIAEDSNIVELLEAISQGVQFEEIPQTEKLILAPSFWASPLLLWGMQTPQQMLLVFGARPSDASMVPGDVIPDALFQALKALADPTRLRILRYLMAKPMTPAELARRLRLRPPTVIHHLDTLRLARLIYVTISYEGRRYQARKAAVEETYSLLDTFLGMKEETEKEKAMPAPRWPADMPY
jgi:DNA-binding transcriptional ArsR family regulator